MTDPRPASDPSGCVIDGMGVLLLCACVGSAALCAVGRRYDIAGLFAIAAAVVFASLALSSALRGRR
jgi:hypothetical protein